MNQITITKIDNGFLVASVGASELTGGQPQQKLQYCSDFVAVHSYLKSIWPVELMDISERN